MNKYEFTSIFAQEMNEYMKLKYEAIKYSQTIQISLKSLDKYLAGIRLNEKVLSSEIIYKWQETQNVSLVTKNKYISAARGFVKYLVYLGVNADCPEYLKNNANYEPYVFSSIFANEIEKYLKIELSAGKTIHDRQSALRDFDKYLVSINLTQKILHSHVIYDWQKNRKVRSRTKYNNISCLRGFAKYLNSIGIQAECAEFSKMRYDVIPYVLSDSELEKIFTIADNMKNNALMIHSAFMFPVLLRILYGCGLRLGEGISLRWEDIDFVKGIIIVRKAKNQKQRIVPIHASLAETLKSYSKMVNHMKICREYVFESDCNNGKQFSQNAFYMWFMKIIKETDIVYSKRSSHERSGPCPHSIRHTFTLKSFLKHEDNGERFENYVPFLAAYLGHSSPRGTEEYLRSSYTIYTKSHQRVNAAVGNLFPEVNFDEE